MEEEKGRADGTFKRLHLEPRTSGPPQIHRVTSRRSGPSVNKTADKLLTILVMHPRVQAQRRFSRSSSLLARARPGPNKIFDFFVFICTRSGITADQINSPRPSEKEEEEEGIALQKNAQGIDAYIYE